MISVETKKKIDLEISKQSQEPKRRFKYKKEYNGTQYLVSVELPKSMDVSMWLAEYLFNTELLKKPFRLYNKPSYYDGEKLKLISVLNIEEIQRQPKKLFKRF